ncbi:MAG: LysM peptidoglycan-binding domain-containing protein [Verrucomicrobia bacterium]|nr:LysM peptidoglycan-binding domain-containing protein [Verrucomicrobiota bacterium]
MSMVAPLPCFARLCVMIFTACRRLAFGLLLLLSGTVGCIPTRDNGGDEEREPHFQRGREMSRAQDFRGAAEAFERAVEANPRSGAAHFELGLLYETRLNDPAAAVFHFERFLKLRPTSDKADVARQRATSCKMELAKLFLIAPNTPSVQKEMDKLRGEIERLGLENHQLRRHVEVLTAQAAARGVLTTAAPPAVASSKQAPAPPTPVPIATKSPGSPVTPSSTRTHTVKAGEIPETIARRHGVKVEALLAANPGLDPKRLRIGQTLNLPAP